MLRVPLRPGPIFWNFTVSQSGGGETSGRRDCADFCPTGGDRHFLLCLWDSTVRHSAFRKPDRRHFSSTEYTLSALYPNVSTRLDAGPLCRDVIGALGVSNRSRRSPARPLLYLSTSRVDRLRCVAPLLCGDACFPHTAFGPLPNCPLSLRAFPVSGSRTDSNRGIRDWK